MNFKKILIFSLLNCSLFSYINAPQQDVAEYEKRLTEIASQIEAVKTKIIAEENRESSILSRLGKLGFQKKLTRNEISLYNTQRRKVNSEITFLKTRIPELEAKRDKERDSIGKILVTLYKFGKLNYFELLMQADDINSLLSENKNLNILAEHHENIVIGYIKNLNDLNVSQENLESKKQEIDQLLQKTRSKQRELEAQENRNRSLIKEIAQNKETHVKALEELKDRAQQLQNLMKKLLSEEIKLPFPMVPLYERKGKLPWPISGKITSRFGLIRHPKFRTLTKNNVIEITPQNNMVIKSVHQGMIVYQDYTPGYGNLIILDHGMAYYSLYGHCSDFLAKKGDVVRAEQPIAIVGDIGSLQGTTLYLEIRYKTRALNPLQWLKKR